MSNIYILVFLKGFVKVGKADDILKRLENLERVWGDVDLVNSYYLSIKKENVFKVEKMLHHLVDAHSTDVGSGDGHTEMFHKDSLPLIVQYLDMYIKNSNEELKLVKGIKKLKPIKSPKEKRYKTKYEKHLEGSNRVLEVLDFNRNVLEFLSRIVGILHKNNDKIEYRIVENEYGYVFIVKDEELCKTFNNGVGIARDVFDIGTIKSDTYKGGVNRSRIISGMSCNGEDVAFRVHTNICGDDGLESYIRTTIEGMVKSLPVKSELAIMNDSGDFGEDLILK